MNYNQTRTQSGVCMPLLMGCTTPSPVETAEEITIIYDPVTQKPVMNLRTVGTYSLKTSGTIKINSSGGRAQYTDRKNTIDDQKIVK